jgi:hypothetical protein
MDRRPHWATALTLLTALAAGTALIAMAAPGSADEDSMAAQTAHAVTPPPETAR